MFERYGMMNHRIFTEYDLEKVKLMNRAFSCIIKSILNGIIRSGMIIFVIEDHPLPGFERYLRNLKHAFPEDYFRKKAEEYTGLMNRWFLVPHWGYDFENLCFIEISHSREYSSDTDKSDEVKADNVIQVVD